jgi:deazaflavin-dependent oxidoreductase (nitroreductase family)
MMSALLYRWILNPLMTLLLKSPLHRLVSKTIMLITFTGRKSGKRFTTPVGYIRDGDVVICVTNANWWKNLRGGARVTLRIHGRTVEGHAEAIAQDKARVAQGIRQFLLQVPSWAGFYNVTIAEDGTPNEEQVARAAEAAILISIRPDRDQA